MALDAQRNWTVSMAENLEHARRRHDDPADHRSHDKTSPTADHGDATTSSSILQAAAIAENSHSSREAVHMPAELLLQIIGYVYRDQASSQSSLASCARVSRAWNAATVPLLYAHPRLYGSNFFPFEATICTSKNLHVRPSPLAQFVKTLDMSALVHQSSKSTTARLIGRTKRSLEIFIAPQASFGSNCLAALSRCDRLVTLDLSLLSESPRLPDLFNTISHLSALLVLRLPRSTGFGVHHKSTSLTSLWPPNLQTLAISGGIDAHFLHGIIPLPDTLTSLTLEHCPSSKGHAVTHLLKNAVQPLPLLRSLKIAHMPCLSTHALDQVLFILPWLQELSIAVDYITPAFFDEANFSHFAQYLASLDLETSPSSLPLSPPPLPPPSSLANHPLRVLELTNSGSQWTRDDKITPIDILITIEEGSLPQLRQVRVAESLHWHSAEVAELIDVLKERAGILAGDDDETAGCLANDENGNWVGVMTMNGV